MFRVQCNARAIMIVKDMNKCHKHHAILHKLCTWFGKNELRLYWKSQKHFVPWKLSLFSLWKNWRQKIAKNLPLYNWFTNYCPGHTHSREPSLFNNFTKFIIYYSHSVCHEEVNCTALPSFMFSELCFFYWRRKFTSF